MKNLNELFVQLNAPLPITAIQQDNFISAWSGTIYGELSVILANLRYVACVHQTHHWVSKGEQFYGDHMLFGRLYDAVNDEIDTVAEKAIGLGTIANVNLVLQLQQICQLSQAYTVVPTIPDPNDLIKQSLVVEKAFLDCIDGCSKSLKTNNLLTKGLDNLLAGICDTHEGHIYLLKQRCS